MQMVEDMAFDFWHYELSVDKAQEITAGSYVLEGTKCVPDKENVKRAAEALKRAKFEHRFEVQSEIMAVAQREGLAFQDWPKIEPLSTE